MKVTTLMFGMLILWIIPGCRNKDQNIDSRFNGMWKLDKIESVDKESGKWGYDSTFYGWNGIILYDGKGHMGVQITPKGLGINADT